MRSANRMVGRVAHPLARVATALDHRGALTLLGWHRIDAGPGGLSTSFDDFRRHLDALEAWGARVLPLPVAVALLAEDALPERAVALTFDDGYASVFERAWPELQRRGLPGTVFVVSSYLAGGRLPWDRHHCPHDDSVRIASSRQVREAADEGFDIGSHTATHPWLPGLAPEDVAVELKTSKADLEDLLQREVSSFAYPMGGWNPEIHAAVGVAGYERAITVDRGRNRPGHDPLALRRAFAFDDAADVIRQLDGAYTWMRPIERRRDRRGPR
ncbi:polysaccharide deacetylase family protein [Nocardioides sp. BP30]|uniref:polysaccharide deacetylase family protein n=1 Tax=Nocardioides sp. BP30 TaxID=3036374 RepID=UPI0024692BA5|nr:polysaccharide deacetylase family protein [Nocardioides sp. BP30]WGL50999.1 polysaccharide deacetylase family protein [Nocardioides sp. BP30]